MANEKRIRPYVPRGRLSGRLQIPRSVVEKIYEHAGSMKDFVEGGDVTTRLTSDNRRFDPLTGLEYPQYSRYLCKQHMKDGKPHDHVCFIDKKTGKPLNSEEYFSQMQIESQVRELQEKEDELNSVNTNALALEALAKRGKISLPLGYNTASEHEKVQIIRELVSEIRSDPKSPTAQLFNQTKAGVAAGKKSKKKVLKELKAKEGELLGEIEVGIDEEDPETGATITKKVTTPRKFLSQQQAAELQFNVIHRAVKQLYIDWSDSNLPEGVENLSQDEREKYKSTVSFKKGRWKRLVFGKWEDIHDKISKEDRDEVVDATKEKESYKKFGPKRLYPDANIVKEHKGAGRDTIMPASRKQYRTITIGKDKGLLVNVVGEAGNMVETRKPLSALRVGNKISWKGRKAEIQAITGNKVKIVISEQEGAPFIGQDPTKGVAVQSQTYREGQKGFQKRRLRMLENKKALKGKEYTDLSECFKCGGRFEDARQTLAKTNQPFNFLGTEQFRGRSKQSVIDETGMVGYAVCQSCEIDGYVESPMMPLSSLSNDVQNAMKIGSVLSVNDDQLNDLMSGQNIWEGLDVTLRQRPENQTGYMQGDFLSSMSPKQLKVKIPSGETKTIDIKMPTLPRKIKNPKLKEGQPIWAWTQKLFKDTDKGTRLMTAEPTKEYGKRQLPSDPMMRHYANKMKGTLGPEFNAIAMASFDIINTDKSLTKPQKSTAYNSLFEEITRLSNTEGGLSFLGEQNRTYKQLKHTEGARKCDTCGKIDSVYLERGFRRAVSRQCLRCEHKEGKPQKRTSVYQRGSRLKKGIVPLHEKARKAVKKSGMRTVKQKLGF